MSLFPKFIATLACAAAVGAIAAPAFADEVTPLTVTGKAPTSFTINIVGKSSPQVKTEIRAAASVVCHNAFRNGELGFYGDDWCPIRAANRAYDRYDAIMHAPGATMASVTIETGATN